MLNRIIEFSLKNRVAVTFFCALLMVYGVWVGARLPVDVFPDLNRPTVTLFSEAEGLSPEEVEQLVSLPLEQAMGGALGVERVRSTSTLGLSLVWVEFDWAVPVAEARRTVTERLQAMEGRLPEGVNPVMGPVSSIMGEILLVGLSATRPSVSRADLRTLAEWTVRPRLLGVGGVSQVTVMGGDLPQVQVLLRPQALTLSGLSAQDVTGAVLSANLNTSGNFWVEGDQEKVVRHVGRMTTLQDLENAVVGVPGGRPVLLSEVADVTLGVTPKRGDASVGGKPAVILSVQKQPGQSTQELTQKIEHLLKKEIKNEMPGGVRFTLLFKQADFIERAIENVKEALRDGSLMVLVVLLMFLMNWRTTAITLTAIPLSFVTTLLVLSAFGLSLNTMTLGGLAVAIGELVDDAVVDVENVYRRLRQNAARPDPLPVLRVVAEASQEVRNSIVYATVIVGLVFLPLFFLSGVEGRLFQPLGVSYLVALGASLLVSLTLTPALCSFLLARTKGAAGEGHQDGFVLRFIKTVNGWFVHLSLSHPWKVLLLAGLVFVLSASALPFLGREFLPPFNEGTLTINVVAQPGISLAASNRLGTLAEKRLLAVPEVKSTGRRTGRAENDDHAEGVHSSEIDVDLRPSQRSKEEILAHIRLVLADIPGVVVNVGQPISHRLDHLLSGVRAQLAVKVIGQDLGLLRQKAEEARRVLSTVPGVVDLAVEKQVLTPQVRVTANRDAAARHGINVGELNTLLEIYAGGHPVGNWLQGRKTTAIVVKAPQRGTSPEAGLASFPVPLPGGGQLPVEQLARVETTSGPNQIVHENGERRMVVMANVQGRDLGAVVEEVRQALAAQINPQGVRFELGGQFQAQQSAARTMLLLGAFSLLGIFVVLWLHFGWARLALMVMVNIPLAMVGGVLAVVLLRLPLSVATLIGFITLCGISSRNGIMMVSHYLHLVAQEGEGFSREMIFRGTQERLAPVLMTALTAMLALLPLVRGAGQPGRELLHPIAVVIFGGLFTSTLMDQMVTPALFWLFGSKTCRPDFAKGGEHRYA